jgi:hypothetical protein
MTTAVLSRYEIDVEDVEYLRHDNKSLLARIYKPRGAGPFPLIVDLHGGAWCKKDRTADAGTDEPLARSGVVVVALDFRMPPDAGYPASLADINYAIRWCKARAADWAAVQTWWAFSAYRAAATKRCWQRCARTIRAMRRCLCPPSRPSTRRCGASCCAGR